MARIHSDNPNSAPPVPVGTRSARERRQLKEWIRTAIRAAAASAVPTGSGLELQSAWFRLPPSSNPGEVLLLCPLPAGRALPRGVASHARLSLLRHPPGDGLRVPSASRDEGDLFRIWVPLEVEFPGVPGLAVMMVLGALDDGLPGERAAGEDPSGSWLAKAIPHPDGPCPSALPRFSVGEIEHAKAALHRGVLEVVRILNAHLEGARKGDGENPAEDERGLGEPTRSPRRARRVVEQMLAQMHSQYSNRLTLEDVADSLRMNAAYLSSLFSRSTGMTFHRKLEEIRMERARTLLRDPKNRVREIATAVGYASSDAFRHAFKAVTGVSPSEWRAGLDETGGHDSGNPP